MFYATSRTNLNLHLLITIGTWHGINGGTIGRTGLVRNNACSQGCARAVKVGPRPGPARLRPGPARNFGRCGPARPGKARIGNFFLLFTYFQIF
jgi:hypothetical protein